MGGEPLSAWRKRPEKVLKSYTPFYPTFYPLENNKNRGRLKESVRKALGIPHYQRLFNVKNVQLTSEGISSSLPVSTKKRLRLFKSWAFLFCPFAKMTVMSFRTICSGITRPLLCFFLFVLLCNVAAKKSRGHRLHIIPYFPAVMTPSRRNTG